MIPKKIHYCWFGRGELPDLAVKCIRSWKKHLPDYEIIEWNEDNFDINSNKFVKEAYESKKFAFVTDYVRLYALYHYGGIYMDSDVEVLKPLDIFLKHQSFTGCENESMCVTGIMGSEKEHAWVGRLLKYYKDKKFILPNGKLNTMSNTEIITKITTNEYGWTPQDKHQILKEGIHIYPFKVFCAKDWRTGEVSVTEQTYTIHHFTGSWINDKDRKRGKRKKKIKHSISKLLGEDGLDKLLGIRKNILNKRE